MSEENEIIYDTNNSKHDTRFHQQNINAWKPDFSMSSVFPALFICGSLFLIIGGALMVMGVRLEQIEVDYTLCKSCTNVTNCVCNMKFNVTKKIKGPVYLYYKLYNFYQNHRRFVSGRDGKQLAGRDVNYDTISSKCEPYRRTIVNGTKKIYAPCGLVANSLFNDTLQLKHVNGGSETSINITKTGIAWDSEINLTYGKPKSFKNTLKLPGWKVQKTDLYKDEDLIVWMRVAPLPTFKKLYGIFKVKELAAGIYNMKIAYNFPVKAFNGRKSFVLTNTNFLGGKNQFMSYAFLTVGCLQLLLSIFFCLIPCFFRKSRPSFSDIPLIRAKHDDHIDSTKHTNSDNNLNKSMNNNNNNNNNGTDMSYGGIATSMT